MRKLLTDRLQVIFDNLPKAQVFADIGCDHGYIAQAMLNYDKAKKVIISDLSEKCLNKAINLLSEYVDSDRVISVVSDGFKSVPECDVALVAGMGGEEIVSILQNAPFLPEKLVLQPMKNTDKVRRCVVELGYKIVKDFLFVSSGKFYDLIVLKKGIDSLTDQEIEFGRTNLIQKNSAFSEFIKRELEKIDLYLTRPNLSQNAKSDLEKKKEKYSKYV